MLLAIVYRSLHSDYLTDFQKVLLTYQNNYIHSVTFGDFNADINIKTYDNRQLLNFIDSSGLFLISYRTTT